MNSETLGLALFTATTMGIYSTRFKCFETENTANPSLKTSPTIYMTLSQKITQVGKIPTYWSCRNSTKSVSMRSPRRVDRLCFLLRREQTIRTAENLERRSSLSLSKSQIPATARFLLSNGDENYSLFCFIHLTFSIIPIMSLPFTI